MIYVHIDTETRSELDPKKVSFDTMAKNCELDIVTWGVSPDPRTMPKVVHAWDALAEPTVPPELDALFTASNTAFVAFNAGFDSTVIEYTLGHELKNRWLDSGVYASVYGTSVTKLEWTAKVLQCRNQKIELTKGLMKLFSGGKLYGKAKTFKGRKLYNNDGTIDQEYYKELRGEYIKYAIMDTWTSAEIWVQSALRGDAYPYRQYCLDQKINKRGIRVDLDSVRKMIAISTELKEFGKQELRRICNVDYEVASHTGFARYLTEHVPDWVGGSRKDDVLQLAAGIEDENDPLKLACELKVVVTGTANAKFQKILDFTDPVTGRLYNQFRFSASARTGRTSGDGVQMLNLARPYKIKTYQEAVEAYNSHVNWWKAKYKAQAATVAAKSVRAVFIPDEGNQFIDYDLNSIENVLAMYFCNDREGLRIRAENLDPYCAFGAVMFGVPYEEVIEDTKSDGKMRQQSKPGVLGCFAKETPVLTDSGWKDIIDVKISDRVWTGSEFSSHKGVQCVGYRDTITFDGIRVTPNHLFMTREGWIPVCRLENLLKRTAYSVSGLLQACSLNKEILIKLSAGVNAVQLLLFSRLIYDAVYRQAVFNADRAERQKQNNELEQSYTTNWLTDFIRRGQDVVTPKIKNIMTMGREALSVILKPLNSGLNICMMNSVSEAIKRSTELIITVTTKKEIFNYQPDLNNARTCGQPVQLSTRGTHGHTQNFVEDSLSTQTAARSHVPIIEDSQRNKSSRIPVYDVVGVEKGSRFTIKGKSQNYVVHNSTYAMSGGGLIDFAKGMGIYITKEFADRTVQTWRSIHVGVVDAWEQLDSAFKTMVHQQPGTLMPLNQYVQNHPATLERRQDAIVMRLPSGRGIWYRDPRVEKVKIPLKEPKLNPYTGGVETHFETWSMTYLNNKRSKVYRESTHGGKLLGNTCQAIGNDIQRDWMQNVDEAGLDINIHVHDQIVTNTPRYYSDRAKEIMIECLPANKDPDHWSAGWGVSADGAAIDRFWK